MWYKKWKECNLYKHWFTWTSIHGTWKRIRQRCSLLNWHNYKYYWAKWIKVCERWNDFTKFYKDMNSTWREWLEIDRIDSNWNYEPWNCRWATKKQQANNQSNNRNIEYNWRTQTMSEWADETWLYSSLIRWRLNKWWDIWKALTKLPNKYNLNKIIWV